MLRKPWIRLINLLWIPGPSVAAPTTLLMQEVKPLSLPVPPQLRNPPPRPTQRQQQRRQVVPTVRLLLRKCLLRLLPQLLHRLLSLILILRQPLVLLSLIRPKTLLPRRRLVHLILQDIPISTIIILVYTIKANHAIAIAIHLPSTITTRKWKMPVIITTT